MDAFNAAVDSGECSTTTIAQQREGSGRLSGHYGIPDRGKLRHRQTGTRERFLLDEFVLHAAQGGGARIKFASSSFNHFKSVRIEKFVFNGDDIDLRGEFQQRFRVVPVTDERMRRKLRGWAVVIAL